MLVRDRIICRHQGEGAGDPSITNLPRSIGGLANLVWAWLLAHSASDEPSAAACCTRLNTPDGAMGRHSIATTVEKRRDEDCRGDSRLRRLFDLLSAIVQLVVREFKCTALASDREARMKKSPTGRPEGGGRN